MKIDTFDTQKKVLIIAEIGNNHEGNFALAEELIKKAAEAGVDAVKFQTIIPEKLVSAMDQQRIGQLLRFQFSIDQFKKLNDLARECGLIFLSTPFDIESARELSSFVPAFKVASGDNTFFPMIEFIAQTGKPIILSSGLIDFAGIEQVRNFIFNVWKNKNIQQELAILHCVAGYPTPHSEANLGSINNLKTLVPTVGYSDHTLGIEAATIAVALGARIIEKHFTIQKDYSEFRDHQLSADPAEMKELVKCIRQVNSMIGNENKCVANCETENVMKARRSIVAKRAMQKGERIGENDIDWVRPGGGLPPGKESMILGKQLKNNVSKGQQILLENIS